jgi:hypothetical protein
LLNPFGDVRSRFVNLALNRSLEVYGFGGGSSGASSEPQRLCARELSESVSALGAGNIMSMERQELVTTTYSGKVTAFAAHLAAFDGVQVILRLNDNDNHRLFDFL